MSNDKPSVLDRKSLHERQQLALEQLEANRSKLRDVLRIVAKTNEGQMLLRYIYLLSGGDRSPMCMDPDGRVSTEKTFLLVGRAEVYKDLRLQLESDVVKLIERPEWETPAN
jgi:hypothetical protein